MYQKKRCIISLSEVVKFLTKWADKVRDKITKKEQKKTRQKKHFFRKKGEEKSWQKELQDTQNLSD